MMLIMATSRKSWREARLGEGHPGDRRFLELPIGVFIYLITQARGMAERSVQQAQTARHELRRAVGFSVADDISNLGQLKKAGSISERQICSSAGRTTSGGAARFFRVLAKPNDRQDQNACSAVPRAWLRRITSFAGSCSALSIWAPRSRREW
jgi:hypothetical protein